MFIKTSKKSEINCATIISMNKTTAFSSFHSKYANTTLPVSTILLIVSSAHNFQRQQNNPIQHFILNILANRDEFNYIKILRLNTDIISVADTNAFCFLAFSIKLASVNL